MKTIAIFSVFSQDYLHIVSFETNIDLEFMPRKGDKFRFDERLFLEVINCNYNPINSSIFIEFESPRYKYINSRFKEKEENILNWILREKKRFLDLGFSITYCDVKQDKQVKIR